MNKITKLLLSTITFTFIILAGVLNSNDIYAAETVIYLNVGDVYTQNVTCKKPVFDAYGSEDKAIVTAEWDKEKPENRTKFTIKAVKKGVATFYVCNNGTSSKENRVRTVSIYVYDTKSTVIDISNSTSITNGTYKNVPVYLYKTKTSICSVSDSYGFPTNVGMDTSGKAKGGETTYTINNAVAKVSSVVDEGVVEKCTITAVGRGYTEFVATRSWTTSAGTVITVKKSIPIYVYDMPVLAIYDGNKALSEFSFTMIDRPALTLKFSNLSSYEVYDIGGASSDNSKFQMSRENNTFNLIPVSETSSPAKAIFAAVLNDNVRIHNGVEAATFTLSIPVTVLPDPTVYVTSVSFPSKTISVEKGKSVKQVANVLPVNASDPTVTYTSSDTSVATVSSDGTVTSINCGTSTITATSNQVADMYDSYTITVKMLPTTITSINKTSDGLKLTWNGVSGASKYHIYRSTNPNSGYKEITTCTENIYTDDSAKYGTTYYYKIAVEPSAGETFISADSNVVSGVKSVDTPTIKSVSKSNGQVQVSITKIDDCDGYVIYKGKGNKVALVATTSQTAIIYLDEGVYYLSVRAYKNVSGEKVYSDYSNIYELTITSNSAKITNSNANNNSEVTTPSKNNNVSTNISVAKTKIKKIKAKKKSLKIKLKKVKNATGYIIKYSKNKKFKKSKNLKITNTKAVIKKLKSNKKYYIKACAYRKIGNKVYYSNYTKVKNKKTK